MVKLITTDTYHGTFSIACDLLGGSVNKLTGKNLFFCDEKASMMAENMVCAKYGGSLNTEVYSFGNYLRAKKKIGNLLSKQGSTMVIKRILNSLPLKCFKQSKINLASSILELIFQLKSANVTCEDINTAKENVGDLLKNKLSDIGAIYQEYEKFLLENGYDDQNSVLSYLPDVIEGDDLAETDVYIVGFSSFTSQVKDVIEKLIKVAKNVTAVLVEGNNTFAYVNEGALAFKNVCKKAGVNCQQERILLPENKENQLIKEYLFNPLYSSTEKIKTDAIYGLTAKNITDEIERIAYVIRSSVQDGMRYKQMSVALPEDSEYREQIAFAFGMMDIPYFLDEPKKADNHPLVLLICAYVELFRKGAGKKQLGALCKNPLWGLDKHFTDRFEKYLIKNNLFYGNFLKPFTIPTDAEEDLSNFENFRALVCSVLKSFSVQDLLRVTDAENRLKVYNTLLDDFGEREESSVNAQMYEKITALLEEMGRLLTGVKIDYAEYKSLFLSGVSALELSIIPQYNDAVFIGGYKEISLAKAEYIFAPGLTSSVPYAKEDVALLTDADIDALSDIKVMIEPKIKVVNHRERESLTLALASFNKKLFLSIPMANQSGEKNINSDALNFFINTYQINPFPNGNGYYTQKQGLITFAKTCSRFAEGLTDDFTTASCFYDVTDRARADRLLAKSGKEVKIRLDKNQQAVIKRVISPTAIEDFNKCPYMAFLSHGLKIKRVDDGSVSGLSVGNLMHEILSEYLKNFEEITDENSSNKVFEDALNTVLSNQEYQRFLLDPTNKDTVDRVAKECKKYCYKNYLWLKNSSFKPSPTNLEVKFGDGCKYGAIPLAGGKVKLKGKIDRIDTFDDYFRVIDYKTGSADSSEENLFAGVKLQLYLYAAAVKDKKLAGAYYMPINDNFRTEDKKQPALLTGKTLFDMEVIHAQDQRIEDDGESEFLPIDLNKSNTGATDKQTMDALVDYALKISDKTVENMLSGVIVPSPFNGGQKSTCEYCDYKGMCDFNKAITRQVGLVKEDVILDAVKGGTDNE